MTLKDANGTEITVGCRVRHLHEPMPAGQISGGARCHNFFGSSEVVSIEGNAVHVRRTMRLHIPVHLPELLVVV